MLCSGGGVIAEMMPQTVPTVGFNTLDPGDSSTTSYSMADLDLSILAESSYSFQVPSPSHSFPDSAGSPPTLYHSPSPEAGKGFPTQYPPSPEAMDDLDQFVKYSSQMLLSDQPICDTYQRKPSSPPSQPQSPLQDQQADHQLLRQFLNDKSYLQNVKAEPYYDSLSEMLTTNIKQENGSAPTCCGGNNHNNSNGGEPDVCGDVKIEPFLALALDQISQEIELACKTLDISPDPKEWLVGDVKKWVMWTVGQYSLPYVNVDNFQLDGLALLNLTEEAFMRLAPQCGDALMATLDLWSTAEIRMRRSARGMSGQGQGQDGSTPFDLASLASWSSAEGSSSLSPRSLHDRDDSDDEEEENERGGGGGGGGGGRGGSHIHLWQFLKELLTDQTHYGSCIRWLDRGKGVFKIEDSVRVARLWGKRKKRPAMNYDKLSRSIRQYYKKGIMKKTERSQRLVYQFCSPYHL